jgi:hypothetical protein
MSAIEAGRREPRWDRWEPNLAEEVVLPAAPPAAGGMMKVRKGSRVAWTGDPPEPDTPPGRPQSRTLPGDPPATTYPGHAPGTPGRA